jgi:hypothetical protein
MAAVFTGLYKISESQLLAGSGHSSQLNSASFDSAVLTLPF